jgi:hypothetical protein
MMLRTEQSDGAPMPKDRKKSREKRFSVEEYLKKRAALRLLDLPPEEHMDKLSNRSLRISPPPDQVGL